MEIKEKLIEAVDQATMLVQGGYKAKASPRIREAYQLTLENPFLFWDEPAQLASLGRLLMVANLFDLYDDEATNLSLAHLSYFFLSRALQLQAKVIETSPIDQLGYEANLWFVLSKDRVMLVHKCADSFVPTLIRLLFTGRTSFTEEEKRVVDKLISGKIPSMVFYDLQSLEKYFSNFADDPYLIGLETEIFEEKKLGQKDFMEGMKLHNLLFDYLNCKIEQDDLLF